MIENQTLSDEEIVLRVRNREAFLYGELIKRYQNKLSHYLRKFIKEPDALEDVLQEVFIKAYRNLFGFNLKLRFSPWIYRIAHNEAVNYLRKNSRSAISLDEHEIAVMDEKIDLPKELDNQKLHSTLTSALNKIKEKYREPLILYFFEDKSYEEISDILEIPKNTVGTLIMRGKKAMQEILNKE